MSLVSPGRAVLLGALVLSAAACRRQGPPPAPVRAPDSARGGLSPLHQTVTLVAGSGEDGERDGPFAEAQFQVPTSLAASPDGRLLVVAERESCRLRLVHLDEANRVETLGGAEGCGLEDGPLAGARFAYPALVAFASAGSLVVWDADDGRLRLVDLAARVVKTVPAPEGGGWKGAAGLAVRQGSAILSLPAAGRVVAVDLASGAERIVFSGDAALPHPGPLALLKDDELWLTAADGAGLFSLDLSAEGSAPAKRLDAVRLLALAVSGGRLYGVRGEEHPALVRLPEGAGLPLPSPWGGAMPDGAGKDSLLALPASGPVALAGGEGRTLYFTHPALRQVLAVRDLDQGERANGMSWKDGEPDDLAYPPERPRGVFRVLLAGDSHVFHPTFREIPQGFYDRSLTIARRLELLLNTHAALDGTRRGYEVLTKAHVAWVPLLTWPAQELPSLARKWNVDLVVLMVPPGSNALDGYLNNPVDADGLPSPKPDPEYLLLPPEKKLAQSPAARLFAVASARGHTATSKAGFLHVELTLDELLAIPEARTELLELYGRPLGLLRERLAPARLVVCLFSSGDRIAIARERDFYAEIARRRGVELLDVVPEMTALRASYHPIAERGDSDHFTAGGMALFAGVLEHGLAARGFLPR